MAVVIIIIILWPLILPDVSEGRSDNGGGGGGRSGGISSVNVVSSSWSSDFGSPAPRPELSFREGGLTFLLGLSLVVCFSFGDSSLIESSSFANSL